MLSRPFAQDIACGARSGALRRQMLSRTGSSPTTSAEVAPLACRSARLERGLHPSITGAGSRR